MTQLMNDCQSCFLWQGSRSHDFESRDRVEKTKTSKPPNSVKFDQNLRKHQVLLSLQWLLGNVNTNTSHGVKVVGWQDERETRIINQLLFLPNKAWKSYKSGLILMNHNELNDRKWFWKSSSSANLGGYNCKACNWMAT